MGLGVRLHVCQCPYSVKSFMLSYLALIASGTEFMKVLLLQLFLSASTYNRWNTTFWFPGLSEGHISSAQSVVNSLQVVEVLSPSLHSSLSSELFSLLPRLRLCLCSPYTAIRHMSARCFATLAQVQLHTTMQVKLILYHLIVALSRLRFNVAIFEREDLATL